MYHVMEIKISFTMSPRKLRNPDCRNKRRAGVGWRSREAIYEKGMSQMTIYLRQGWSGSAPSSWNPYFDNNSGGNRDAPFRHRSPITSRDTQSCQMWSVFKQLFAAVSSYIHFSLGYKIPSIFLRPDKKVNRETKRNGTAERKSNRNTFAAVQCKKFAKFRLFDHEKRFPKSQMKMCINDELAETCASLQTICQSKLKLRRVISLHCIWLQFCKQSR